MNTGAAAPPRAVLGLTVAVLAVHFWLLRAGAPRLHPRDAARAPAFATRSIAPQAPAATPTVPVAPEPTPLRQPAALPRPPVARVVAAGAAPAPAKEAPVRARRTEAGPPASVFAIPGSMQLRYQLTAHTRGQAWQGRSELLWRHDGDRYEARLESANRDQLPRIQLSTGRITALGLAPGRFSEKGRTEQAVHFEREEQRVIFSNNRPATPLLVGAQDRLSVLLQLSAMLGGEPGRYPPGTRISLQTASIREAETWVFTVGPEERLELPGGSLPAIKLDRPPRHDFDQRVELWLAPGQDYVPVRLRLTLPNGDWVDQQWSSTDRR